MRRLVLILMLGGLLLTGCGGESAKQMLSTARFEQQQGNSEHAAKLYQKIIQKNQDSPEAVEAKAALAGMMEKQGGMGK